MANNSYKRQINPLRDFILKEPSKEYSKQTIKGLFRSIVETVLEADPQEGLVLYRIFDADKISSTIKRLEFSGVTLYSFSDNKDFPNVKNIEKSKIWEDVEFVLVLAQRFSAVLIWDYSIEGSNSSEICLIYNSKEVSDVAKTIFDNAKTDLSEYLVNYAPDRRENKLLNSAINKLVGCFDYINEEFVISQAEKDKLAHSDSLLREYEYTSAQAKFIAHEIKNHLSVVDLYAKIAENRFNNLKMDAETQNSLENAISSIKNSTYSITHFIEELKNHALPILVEKRLSSVISDVVSLCSPKAKEANVKIVVNSKDDFRVHVDEIKIQSVFLNVVYNAIEATDKGGEIVIKTSKNGNFAQIVVSDNAKGIEKNIQAKIFDDGFTTKLTGNGLGLSFSKKIMEMHFGDLKLSKSDENGTDMEILIPIR